MSDRTIIEPDEILGQCPGQCGRAIKLGYVIEDGETKRALLHEKQSCQYFRDRDMATVLADSAKLPKA